MDAESNSAAGIFALLIAIYSWMLTIVLFAGRWLLGPAWPGRLREIVSLVVSICLTGYFCTHGRRHLRNLRRQTAHGPIRVGGGQAIMVIAIVLISGIYGTWLFVAP